MAVDREATLRNAEKFLRVGRLDAAIAEYARVVEDQPRDWSTANTLGDLYLRAGQSDKAVALYRRIADHLLTEGFFPKAAALLKKILKITPDDEVALGHLGDIAARQGLLAEARGYFTSIASRCRARGDAAGADEMVVKLGALDPADLDARHAAAQSIERRGDRQTAALHYRALYDEFVDKGRNEDAASVLAAYLRCHHGDVEAALVLPLLAIDLESGQVDMARTRLPALLATGSEGRDKLLDLAWSLLDSRPDAATWCVDAVVDHAVGAGDYAAAASVLEQLASRTPHNVAALLRLVEVSVDGELYQTMYAAQARLADAYLAAGRADEARVIAEDLVIHDGGSEAHVERLRRAFRLLGRPDPEAAIAERLRMTMLESSDALSAEDLDHPHAREDAPEAAGVDVLTQSASRPIEETSNTRPSLAEAEAEVPAPAQNAAPASPSASPRVPLDKPAASPSAFEIDLTGLVAELRSSGHAPSTPVGAEAEDLDQVFTGLRDEINGDAAEDAGDYVELARTYVEMGLADEAIDALLTAAKSPRWRFTAASMLASLYRDGGDLAQAVEWYERAAEAPAASAEEGRALLYELGDLLETLGETARALAIFMELGSDHPHFRDVSARIARLSSMDGGG